MTRRTPGAASAVRLRLLPKSLQFLRGDKAVFVGIKPVESRTGKFAAAEPAVAVFVGVLEAVLSCQGAEPQKDQI